MLEYKWIILFYAVILGIVIWKRKKFEIQAGFIALYRTRFGINKIYKSAERFGAFIRILGYIGIGIAYVGLIFIFVVLVDNLYKLFTVPGTISGVSLIIPGVQIPGSPIFVPFWFGIISLFIVVVIHEFGHGIVAASHGGKIKNTGVVFFGPLIGAFVEPDEKKLVKEQDVVQYSIYAAGPFANVLLAGVAILVVLFVLNPLTGLLTVPNGFSISSVQENYSAYNAGLAGGMVITGLNNQSVPDVETFVGRLSCVKPNETINITANGTEFSLTTMASPDNPEKGYLGVVGLQNEVKPAYQTGLAHVTLVVLLWLQQLFEWIFILSLGIGTANLLPLGPVDGGRMMQVSLRSVIPDRKKADRLWGRISVITLAILLLNLFFPLFKWLISLAF